MDYSALVSQSDLVYQSPAEQAVEGQPIGNGNMGTLVWTAPNAVYFQINRSDVFAVNKGHSGRFTGPTDYFGACAQIAVDVGGRPFAEGKSFTQRLSLYEAEATIAGEAVSARCFVSAALDVLALEIDDRRVDPRPIRVTLSMLRAPEVVTGSHSARSELVESTHSALLVQRFHEKDYDCASAVAVRIMGDGTEIQVSSDKTRTIVVPAKEGKRTILISSAASWAPGADVGKTAVDLLGSAGKRTYDDLLGEHTRWWRDFWSRTFVHLTSEDGLAEFMQRVRCLHLYYMASSSRGVLPPKWNGSLFITGGDRRNWGSQFWVWTTEMAYFPLFAADAIDLTKPYFDMYVRQLPDCEKAAVQRWNSKGAYFPETTPFDGPVVLPEDIALEYRQVISGEKKNTELSDRARALGLFESHLFVLDHPTTGRYTWISHVTSSGSELAVQAWWRYRYTGDTAWLRTHAYPLLRGTVEFYRHLVTKDQDGRYHTYGTHAHEDFWGVKDSIWDLAAIRGTAPLAIRAAELLGVDAELRAGWKELLDNLAPYPMGRDPQSKALKAGVLADNFWAAGHLGDVNDGHRNSEDVWFVPIFPFEDWTLETRSGAVDKTVVQKAFDLAHRHASVMRGDGLNTAIRTPIAAARAGCGGKLTAILASYYAALNPNVPNGMSLFEGPKDPSVENLGLISTTLQEGLLQSVSARPGGPEVISVFPAWPKEWKASFRLLARGGFLITSATGDGKVEFVEIESRLGEKCRLRNPWGTPCLVAEIGGKTQRLNGDLLSFDTAQGKRYRVVPEGEKTPTLRRIAPAPTTEPISYSLKLSSGKTVKGTLGRRSVLPIPRDPNWAASFSDKVLSLKPVAYWKFDGDLTDSSGNGNTLTAFGTAGLAPGQIGQAANLANATNGNGFYVDTPAGSSLNLTGNQWSINLWYSNAKSANTSTGTAIMVNKRAGATWTGDYWDYGLWMGRTETVDQPSNHLVGTMSDGSGSFVYPTSASLNPAHISADEANQWHMATVTWDTGTTSFYLDGRFLGSAAKGGKLTPSTYRMILGNSDSPGTNDVADNYWQGRLDEIAVFDKALSAADIAALYGTPVAPP